MAKSRVKANGCIRGRLKRKMLGKGCSTRNRKVAKRLPRLVHLKFPTDVD